MTKRRRIEQFLSIVFLAVGASLLLFVTLSWFLAMQAPDVINQASTANHTLLNLPPALKPAPQTAGRGRASVPQISGQPIDAPLLPESPLEDEEIPTGRDHALEPAPPLASSDPRRIIIPALGVDAPIQPAGVETRQDGERTYRQWSVPDAYAAGWHETSAPLGLPGNIVLNGHNNVHGAIFGELVNLAVGEQIILSGDEGVAVYRVSHHELLQEHGASLRQRLQNARWIAATADDRLTLVTCWPNTTNSHRLIVVAEPLGDGKG